MQRSGVDVGALDSIGNGFYRYAGFSGRAGRREFAYWMLFTVLTIAAFFMLSHAYLGLFGNSSPPESVVVAVVPVVVLALPTVAVTVRRLHDVGNSGWWLLLVLVCNLALPVILIVCVFVSGSGPNKFDRVPRASAPHLTWEERIERVWQKYRDHRSDGI